MSTPVEFNVSWVSGDTSYLELFYDDADGEMIDLTGASIAMGIKTKRTDSDPVIPTKLATWEPDTGRILFTYDPYETLALMPDGKTKVTYYYDVEITTAGGEVTTILNGKLTVDRSITNQYGSGSCQQ